MNVKLESGEKIEPLGKQRSIIVSKEHTFGTDAVLLSYFASPNPKDRICDMGTGCGIIPLLLSKKETGHITAAEIQPKACGQLERTLILNDLCERIEVKQCDIRNLKGVLPMAQYDLVTMNPPYKPVGTGIESVSESDKIARHETMCTVDDCVKAAAGLLRFSGRFCLCHRPERLCDIIVSMRENKLEAKRIRFVCQTEGKAPWLVLVEGRRGGKSHVTVEKNLIMKNSDGTITDEMREIFGDYAEGHQ